MGIIELLRSDEELDELRKVWKEKKLEPLPPFNFDEYSGITDYKNKIKKNYRKRV